MAMLNPTLESQRRCAEHMAKDVLRVLDLFYRKLCIREIQFTMEYYRNSPESKGMRARMENHDQFHHAFPRHGSGNWCAFATMVLVCPETVQREGMTNWQKGGKAFEEFLGWMLRPETLNEHNHFYAMAHRLVDLIDAIEKVSRFSEFREILNRELDNSFGIHMFESMAERLVEESVVPREIPEAKLRFLDTTLGSFQ